MATIKNIDKDAYAEKALELLAVKKGMFVNYALNLLKASVPKGKARDQLASKVYTEMKSILFNYLKRSGKVQADYKYKYDYIAGCYRTVQREPQKSEVPPSLMDIKKILPNYGDVIGDIMLEAEKRLFIGQIETITKESTDTGEL